MDPVDKYLIRTGEKFSIKHVPLNVIVETLKFYGHLFDDKYVYGIKFVSQKNQDMFEVNTYKIGDKYQIDIGEESDFNNLYDHTPGLWSYGCIKEAVINHIKINKRSVLNKPIVIRYLIGDIIIIGNYLKGTQMEILSENMNKVMEILNHGAN